MKNIYLSIDLDFWNEHRDSRFAVQFISSILDLSRPIKVVVDHSDLLDDIDQSKARKLINVDYHSDVTDPGDIKCNDGTWVNFVRWKKRGCYEWRYPKHYPCVVNGKGFCHSGYTAQNEFDPFSQNNTGWRYLTYREGILDINFDMVERVGIALSPVWVFVPSVEDVFFLLNERGLLTNFHKKCLLEILGVEL